MVWTSFYGTLLTLIGLLVMPSSALAGAALFESLKCYDVVKDLRGSPADLGELVLTPNHPDFLEQSGCRIQGAAREICTPVGPSVPPGGTLAADYVCYKLKCDAPQQPQPLAIEVADGIGGGVLLVRQKKTGERICLPNIRMISSQQ